MQRWSRRVQAVRALVVAVALVPAGAAFAAAPASAAAPTQFGSDLAKPANLPFGCELRPYTTPGGGVASLIQTGLSTCMWWQSGVSAASTYVPRGQGTVIGARVKVGNNPAPLKIAIISSGGNGLCCTMQSESPVFTPAANAVTTVPLSLPAGAGIDPTRSGGQYNDIVVVKAVGPGSLPVNDTGRHGSFDLSQGWAAFIHGDLPIGAPSLDVGTMDGYEVLLQVLWCGDTKPEGLAPSQVTDCTVNPPPVAVTPTPGGAGNAGGAGTPPAVTAKRLSAPISKGRARVRLACAVAACSGTVVLTKPGKKTLLGRKTSFALAAGTDATVRVPLTGTGKAAVKKKAKVSADAVVTFAGGATSTVRVSLRR